MELHGQNTCNKGGLHMEDKLEKLKKKNNDLSDIILEKEDSGNEKIKKIILGVASLVLLFLIILIAMKMLNSSNVSPSENLANVGEKIEQESDVVVDKGIAAIEDTKDTLFKEEPIIDEASETDLKFEEMVRKLKQQDALESQDVNTPSTEPEQTAAATILNETKSLVSDTSDNVVDKIKEVTNEPVKSTESKVKEVIDTIIPEPKTTKPAAVAPKEVVVASKPVSTPAPSPISSMSGYFIQVGATSQSFPDKRFLEKIKSAGFDYIVHKVNVKGQDIKKVLVGPYATRDLARNDLSAVQTKINPSAYIYRIK